MPSIERGSGWRGIALQALAAMLLGLWWMPAVKAFNPGCPPFPGIAAVAPEASLVLDDAPGLSGSSQPLEPDDACARRGSGKLLELGAFSGKMLGAAVLGNNHNNGDGVAGQGADTIISDSSGGLNTLVERPGSGGRRILWRQIQ